MAESARPRKVEGIGNETHLTARPDKQMPLETNSRTVATTQPASAKYALHIPTALGMRLKRCRESVRTAIRTQLQDIARAAGGARKVKLLMKGAPGLRFYIHESYKVSYEVDAKTRRVVLLDLGRVGP
jgi:hypothetical protein